MIRRHRSSRPICVNAHLCAMEGAGKLPEADRENLKNIVTQSFVAFCRGEQCELAWKNMADALNVAEALARGGICSDADSKAVIKAGQDVVVAVVMRHADTASWTLRAPEMQSLRIALERHRIQLDYCSVSEYQAAQKRVTGLSRQALRGNVAKGVLIVDATPRKGKS